MSYIGSLSHVLHVCLFLANLTSEDSQFQYRGRVVDCYFDSSKLSLFDIILIPIGSMGLVYLPTFTYIYHKKQPNVGEYTSPMDGMGLDHLIFAQ